jgi:hypothetical protein
MTERRRETMKIKRPVESGWGGDAVVCADSVGNDPGGPVSLRSMIPFIVQ